MTFQTQCITLKKIMKRVRNAVWWENMYSATAPIHFEMDAYVWITCIMSRWLCLDEFFLIDVVFGEDSWQCTTRHTIRITSPKNTCETKEMNSIFVEELSQRKRQWNSRSLMIGCIQNLSSYKDMGKNRKNNYSASTWTNREGMWQIISIPSLCIEQQNMDWHLQQMDERAKRHSRKISVYQVAPSTHSY